MAYLQEAFKEAISDSTYEMIAKANDFWLKYLKTEEFNEFYKEEREAYRELFQAIGWGKKETKK